MNKFMNIVKSVKVPIIILLAFWAVAVFFWQTKNNVFFLINFGYIGTALGMGMGLYILLPRKKKPSGRRLAQLLIGLYMLGFLGIIKHENMQIEGFFFYLLSGFFAGSVIHYLVAKLLGPALFGRGYCGWGCWTAMVLDYLPHRRNKTGRAGAKWERLRYAHFTLSLLTVVLLLFVFHYRLVQMDKSNLVWLAGGNIFYYTSAIILALALKDNRAFCKYLCPITVPLKLTSRFSLMKIKGNRDTCIQCGACNKACPMDIDIMAYVRNGERVLSTECIFCLTCTTICPNKSLDSSVGLDIGGKEYLYRR